MVVCQAIGSERDSSVLPSINEELIRKCQDKGILVRPFTVDKEDDLVRFIQAGTDAVSEISPSQQKGCVIFGHLRRNDLS